MGAVAGCCAARQRVHATSQKTHPCPPPPITISTTPKQNQSNITPTLTQLLLADNDFEGDLGALNSSRLMIVSVHSNPKLCGMVPAGVRYAKGYNPAGTRLGQPC
jgi:hypothetical protein